MTRYSSKALMRATICSWLAGKQVGFTFTINQACKALGLDRVKEAGAVREATIAYLGILLTTFGGDEAGGKHYKLLRLVADVPQHELPL